MTRRKQVVIVILLALLAGFCGFCYYYPFIRVIGYRLVIDGTEIDADFRKMHNCEEETNLFRQPLERYSMFLLEEFPSLASVTCRIDLSGKVVCEGIPKRPIALICVPQVYGISLLGEILPLAVCGDISDLPLVTGLRLENASPYSTVLSFEAHQAIRLCGLLSRRFPALRSAISEIDFSSESAPVLFFRESSVRAVMGRGNFEEKLAHLNHIVNRLGTLPAGELDLRFGRSIVAKDLT